MLHVYPPQNVYNLRQLHLHDSHLHNETTGPFVASTINEHKHIVDAKVIGHYRIHQIQLDCNIEPFFNNKKIDTCIL